MLVATIILASGPAGRSGTEAPSVPAQVTIKFTRTGAFPGDPAFYRFTGHPAIRAWSSVPRRT